MTNSQRLIAALKGFLANLVFIPLAMVAYSGFLYIVGKMIGG